jgi:hypothetical protein
MENDRQACTKPQDLRVYDWVRIGPPFADANIKGRTLQVVNIGPRCVVASGQGIVQVPYGLIEGIKVTGEVLERYNKQLIKAVGSDAYLTYSQSPYVEGAWRIQLSYVRGREVSNEVWMDVRYVHELQNAAAAIGIAFNFNLLKDETKVNG